MIIKNIVFLQYLRIVFLQIQYVSQLQYQTPTSILIVQGILQDE